MKSYVTATLSRRYTSMVGPSLPTTGSISILLPSNMSSSILTYMKSILKSLHQFQTICPAIKRTDNNPFFKSKYASLESIQQHIKPHLAQCGLVITQANTIINDLPFVQTTVWHVESGESVVSVFPVVAAKANAQDYGSAVSYAKRYSLTGLLNLIIQDEDDDGNAAVRSSQTVKASPAVNVSNELPALSQEKYDAMVKFINEGKIDQVESALKKYSLNESQKKVLTSLINQAKSQAVVKAAKKK